MENTEFIYICDGTIEGLLSAIYKSYYSRDNVFDIISSDDFQSSFAYEYRNVATDFKQAQKVAYAIKSKISRLAFESVINVWLTESRLRGHHILEYTKLGFKKGKDVDCMLTQENVAFVQMMSRKVEFEVHRFLGILRFSKLHDGSFFSSISTDYNILSLIAEHFSQRLSEDRLIIYDEKRENAILADRGEWILVNGIKMGEVTLSQDELAFRDMWQRYFEAIAIKERTNKKLQRSFIPVRYWSNVTELKKELQ